MIVFNPIGGANIAIETMEIHVIDKSDSLANHFLAELRDPSTQIDRLRFRKNLERLGSIMAYEFSKTLDYVSEEVKTPLGVANIPFIQNNLIMVTVLRAGLPFYNGFLEFFDRVDSGFIGAFRSSEGEMSDIAVDLSYIATQDLSDKEIMLIDPMLATGKSLIEAITAMEKNGLPRKIHIFSVIAAPEGIENLKGVVNVPIDIWTASMDEKLNQKAYIVPGLGDAGDLCFGEKI